MVNFKEICFFLFFKVPEGVQHFTVGGGGGGGVGQTFSWGVQLLTPYRNPNNL